MKFYKEPKMEVLKFEVDDVVTTSSSYDNETEEF